MSSVNACTHCQGKFGLIRYWLWYKPFCRKSCIEEFKRQAERHRTYLKWLFEPP